MTGTDGCPYSSSLPYGGYSVVSSLAVSLYRLVELSGGKILVDGVNVAEV